MSYINGQAKNLQESLVGWVAFQIHGHSQRSVNLVESEEHKLDKLLKTCWEIEDNCDEFRPTNSEDIGCGQHF